MSGAPAPELDSDTAHLDRLIDQAIDAGEVDEVNRLETWLWLDGPAQPEGRVDGAVRSLMLEMNRIILANGASEEAGASSVDAWNQLDRVNGPVTVACRGPGRQLPGRAEPQAGRALAPRAPPGSHRRGAPAAARGANGCCRRDRRGARSPLRAKWGCPRPPRRRRGGRTAVAPMPGDRLPGIPWRHRRRSGGRRRGEELLHNSPTLLRVAGRNTYLLVAIGVAAKELGVHPDRRRPHRRQCAVPVVNASAGGDRLEALRRRGARIVEVDLVMLASEVAALLGDEPCRLVTVRPSAL